MTSKATLSERSQRSRRSPPSSPTKKPGRSTGSTSSTSSTYSKVRRRLNFDSSEQDFSDPQNIQKSSPTFIKNLQETLENTAFHSGKNDDNPSLSLPDYLNAIYNRVISIITNGTKPDSQIVISLLLELLYEKLAYLLNCYSSTPFDEICNDDTLTIIPLDHKPHKCRTKYIGLDLGTTLKKILMTCSSIIELFQKFDDAYVFSLSEILEISETSETEISVSDILSLTNLRFITNLIRKINKDYQRYKSLESISTSSQSYLQIKTILFGYRAICLKKCYLAALIMIHYASNLNKNILGHKIKEDLESKKFRDIRSYILDDPVSGMNKKFAQLHEKLLSLVDDAFKKHFHCFEYTAYQSHEIRLVSHIYRDPVQKWISVLTDYFGTDNAPHILALKNICPLSIMSPQEVCRTIRDYVINKVNEDRIRQLVRSVSKSSHDPNLRSYESISREFEKFTTMVTTVTTVSTVSMDLKEKEEQKEEEQGILSFFGPLFPDPSGIWHSLPESHESYDIYLSSCVFGAIAG